MGKANFKYISHSVEYHSVVPQYLCLLKKGFTAFISLKTHPKLQLIVT